LQRSAKLQPFVIRLLFRLLHQGYTQAEGVTNLDQVPEKGCLVTIGYPKFAGGRVAMLASLPSVRRTGKYGVTVGETPEAPLPKSDKILQWDAQRGMRVRK
jgi:hypothetical protein